MAKKEKQNAEAVFDYAEAVKELEAVAAKVEDPATGLDDIDKYIRRAQELVTACRAYLRTARDKADAMDTIE